MRRMVLRAFAGFCSLVVPISILILLLATMPSSRANFASTEAGPVRSLAWSGDGNWIASGADDGKIRVWNAQTQALQTTFEAGGTPVNSLAFSPDSGFLAAGSGAVSLWATTWNEQPTHFEGQPLEVRRVLWSDDGTRLAAQARDSAVVIWDAATGRALSQFNQFDRGLEVALALSAPDVQTVSLAPFPASEGCDRYNLALNNAAAQQTILKNYAAPVNDVVWSPQHTLLAVAPSETAAINIWDVATGALKFSTTCIQATSLAWAPNGERLAVGEANGQIEIWTPAFHADMNYLWVGLILALVSGYLFWRWYRALSLPPLRLQFRPL